MIIVTFICPHNVLLEESLPSSPTSPNHLAGFYCSVYAAFKRLSRLEGIIPALETSHALAYLEKLCPTLPDGTKVVLNCSGRGDKDVNTAINYLKL